MAATLILSAWEPEIAPLRRLARAVAPGRSRSARWASGPSTRPLAPRARSPRPRPERGIFVGTAGAYPRSRATLAIGTVAVADELYLVSTAALRGDGYLPEPLATRAESASLGARCACGRAGGVCPARVACPWRSRARPRSGATSRRDRGGALENLEAFAVARAAAAAGVDAFVAVLGVANRVGPRGHQEWRAHHARRRGPPAVRLVVPFELIDLRTLEGSEPPATASRRAKPAAPPRESTTAPSRPRPRTKQAGLPRAREQHVDRAPRVVGHRRRIVVRVKVEVVVDKPLVRQCFVAAPSRRSSVLIRRGGPAPRRCWRAGPADTRATAPARDRAG